MICKTIFFVLSFYCFYFYEFRIFIMRITLAFILIWTYSNSYGQHTDTVNKSPLRSDTVVRVDSITHFSKTKTDTLTITAVGDVMLGTTYPDVSLLPPDSGKQLLTYVSPIMRHADLAFGNLEGCILDGTGTVKKCSNPKKCYAFRQPGYMAKRLVEGGFGVVSVANNHVSDFGLEGRESTASILRKNHIHFAGLETCPWDTFTINGVRFGFTAFSVNNGTNKIQDYGLLDGIVKRLDTIADVVIVSFHGGAEGQDHRHVLRKTENYIGEDRGNVYQFAHRAIDDGADLVIGHGPHVPRAVDVYKDHLIIYSLGNFCTYHRFNLEGHASVAPLLEIKISRKGKFLTGKIYSFRQLGEGGPVPDSSSNALNDIKELTLQDIPEVKLHFDDDGAFYLPK